MINELLTEITKAEQAAKILEENALEEAKSMVAFAEEHASNMKDEARQNAKKERETVIDNAEAEATENYARALELGKTEASKLKQATDITSASKKVTALFIKKWAL